LYNTVTKAFRDYYGHAHTIAAYAPGRVEVLGNHTDYNEGYALSAAISYGTYFLVSPAEDSTCRLVAGDLMAEVSCDIQSPRRVTENTWANYVLGVLAGLQARGHTPTGFNAMFLGNIPLGAGLSSSAALEICSGLALSHLYDIAVDRLEMARIGQKAEHEYAGVKCGLLDQVSSLFGEDNALVMIDFRSLETQSLAVGSDAAFLMCNTKAKHALVDGEYNERREHCEAAAAFFNEVLPHPVTALRDVSWAEWESHASAMDPLTARRAAHPIGESERVLAGRALLDSGDLEGFGRLMFESHDSSVNYFENSCAELDTIVAAAKGIPGVLGARLSGGGFGGSVVALIHPRDAETVSHAIQTVFKRAHGHLCDVAVLVPSSGARLIKD